jgi:hypothetical protein
MVKGKLVRKRMLRPLLHDYDPLTLRGTQMTLTVDGSGMFNAGST